MDSHLSALPDWEPASQEAGIPTMKSRLLLFQSHIPLIKKLPPRAVGIVLLLAFVNCAVWAAVGIVLVTIPACKCLDVEF